MDTEQFLQLFGESNYETAKSAFAFPIRLQRGEMVTLKPVTSFLCNRVLATLHAFDTKIDTIQTFSAARDEDMDALNRIVDGEHCAVVSALGYRLYAAFHPRTNNRSRALVSKNLRALHDVFPSPFSDQVRVEPEVFALIADDIIAMILEYVVTGITRGEDVTAQVAMLNLYADALVVGIDGTTALVITA